MSYRIDISQALRGGASDILQMEFTFTSYDQLEEVFRLFFETLEANDLELVGGIYPEYELHRQNFVAILTADVILQAGS